MDGWLRGVVTVSQVTSALPWVSTEEAYSGNTACIKWGNNVISRQECAKHIDIRKYFAHDVIQNCQMLLVKVLTTNQMADILTERLHLQQVLA